MLHGVTISNILWVYENWSLILASSANDLRVKVGFHVLPTLKFSSQLECFSLENLFLPAYCSCYRYLNIFIILRMEKAMVPHSSTPAWKIPWMEEPGRLQSMGSLRVGHHWATSLSLFTFLHWRRKWQPTPVFLPGESQGRGSLVGCRLWSHTESDTTEVT